MKLEYSIVKECNAKMGAILQNLETWKMFELSGCVNPLVHLGYWAFSYTPCPNVWHESKSVIMFGLIKKVRSR